MPEETVPPTTPPAAVPPAAPPAATPLAAAAPKAPPAAAAAPKAPAAAAAAAAAAPPVAEGPKEIKIKVRKLHQRSCDEKDAKGKLCAGHLKRWYDYPVEVERKIGKDAEVYRCEFCRTLYLPDPKQMPNSFTLRY
jgi:hypothetical protein